MKYINRIVCIVDFIPRTLILLVQVAYFKINYSEVTFGIYLIIENITILLKTCRHYLGLNHL